MAEKKTSPSAKEKTFRKLAKAHGFSEDAVAALHDALIRGGGTMAQFHHPELGGSGQWMNNGMIMIGDMFNHALKARVDALCHALRPELEFPSASSPAASFAASRPWWPEEYASPAATGGQNDFRYAYFPSDNALVVEHAGTVTVYDTTGHVITGFSQQQQSSFAGFCFSSAAGQKAAAKLPRKRGRGK